MKLQSASAIPRGLTGACPSFIRALSEGDLDSATACFARKGCLITPDATAIEGRDSIRPVLAQMIARQTKVLVEASYSLTGGGVVLARERWRIRVGEPDGGPIDQILDATLVLHWIEDTWKLAIAAPWGWSASGF
ncbi:MAG: nuclear transport factor 2 family protein [Actinomycetota bacterium]|nr:nuclear transport factor 2 family protein [Actinomycetota bacterium]